MATTERADNMLSAFQYRNLRGASLFRILAGCAVLFQLTLNFGYRDLLYGPDGILPWEDFTAGFGTAHISILAISKSSLWFETCYWIAIVSFGIWVLGVTTRWTTPLCWLLLHSFHARNQLILDGGDNALAIFLLYAVFMKLNGDKDHNCQAAAPSLWCLIHNAALCLFILQVCTIYFIAGAAKLGGSAWIDGTALYYVAASDQFGSPWLLTIIRNLPIVSAIGSWAPLLLQLSFAWIVLFGRSGARVAVVLLAVLFHIGVGVGLGLISFALIMISSEAMLLNNRDYNRLLTFCRSLPRDLSAAVRMQRNLKQEPETLESNEKREEGVPK